MSSKQDLEQQSIELTRRSFLGRTSLGIGALALGTLLGEEQGNEKSHEKTVAGPIPELPHFRPRAKRMIFLHMAGSPPQQDTFDYKPLLNAMNGKPAPPSLYAERSAFVKPGEKILGCQYEFEQVGDHGLWVTNQLPEIRKIVDKITVVRSMHTDQFNHAPAQLFLHTGFAQSGRPSLGSWLAYGLGSESRDLPSFVVLLSGGKKPSAGDSVWGAGFLPGQHQGVPLRSRGDRVLFLDNPKGETRADRRALLDTLRDLNELEHVRSGDPEIETRIAQYELAFRMQSSVPDTMDISKEPKTMLEAYGAEPGKASFAANCLLARRLVESGVRFVQLYDWGWDLHGTSPNDDMQTQFPKKCRATDRPIATLIRDLEQRGLLEDTLVVWSGEFGRTAMNERRNGSKYLGRDHHPHCYSIFLAGAGIRRGYVHGKTDDFGAHVVEDPVHVHDLQATILHLFGIDHTRFTYRFQGLDVRLTNFKGRVVNALMS